MFPRMAHKRKAPKFTHCKVTFTTHPSAPWRVSYPVEIDGTTRRKRRMFSTEEKAMDFAQEHERDVSDHGVRFGSITAEARRAFDFYRDARADLEGEEIEVPSFELLVMSAVADLRQRHADRQRNRMSIAEAVAAFLDYKRTRIGGRHHEGLTGQLGRFAKGFGTTPLDKVTAAEIERWICEIPRLGPVSRNKLRKSLKSLFAYGCATSRAWCGYNPLSDIDKETVPTRIPESYTPAETAAILKAALEMDSPALPELALGFFSGLRPTEIMALDLSAIDFASDEFRTPLHHANGEETKTGTRMAPLTPACKAWLLAQPRRTGKACTYEGQGLSVEIRAILAAAKVRAIYDGRRHSFISYRTAETRDVARVADECGNSPNIIKKHYRDIVTSAAAERYFAIRPPAKAENVTSIEEGRASA